MKKLYLLVLCHFFSLSLFSQTLALAEGEEKTEEKIEPSEHGEDLGIHFNMFFGFSGVKTKKFENPNILLGGDILYLSPKTYHFLAYDFFSNELNTTQGYLWNDNLGSYLFFAYGFDSIQEAEGEHFHHEKRISLGTEYFFHDEKGEIVLFVELGKNLSQKENFFGFGFITELDVKKIFKK